MMEEITTKYAKGAKRGIHRRGAKGAEGIEFSVAGEGPAMEKARALRGRSFRYPQGVAVFELPPLTAVQKILPSLRPLRLERSGR